MVAIFSIYFGSLFTRLTVAEFYLTRPIVQLHDFFSQSHLRAQLKSKSVLATLPDRGSSDAPALKLFENVEGNPGISPLTKHAVSECRGGLYRGTFPYERNTPSLTFSRERMARGRTFFPRSGICLLDL